jgi:hypothetical protein
MKVSLLIGREPPDACCSADDEVVEPAADDVATHHADGRVDDPEDQVGLERQGRHTEGREDEPVGREVDPEAHQDVDEGLR